MLCQLVSLLLAVTTCPFHTNHPSRQNRTLAFIVFSANNGQVKYVHLMCTVSAFPQYTFYHVRITLELTFMSGRGQMVVWLRGERAAKCETTVWEGVSTFLIVKSLDILSKALENFDSCLCWQNQIRQNMNLDQPTWTTALYFYVTHCKQSFWRLYACTNQAFFSSDTNP